MWLACLPYKMGQEIVACHRLEAFSWKPFFVVDGDNVAVTDAPLLIFGASNIHPLPSLGLSKLLRYEP